MIGGHNPLGQNPLSVASKAEWNPYDITPSTQCTISFSVTGKVVPNLAFKSAMCDSMGFIRPCHWTGDSDLWGVMSGGYVRSLIEIGLLGQMNCRTIGQIPNQQRYKAEWWLLTLWWLGCTVTTVGNLEPNIWYRASKSFMSKLHDFDLLWTLRCCSQSQRRYTPGIWAALLEEEKDAAETTRFKL